MTFATLGKGIFFNAEASASRCYQGQITGPFLKLKEPIHDSAGVEHNAVCMGTSLLCIFPPDYDVEVLSSDIKFGNK
jgi:hypothetical protein